MKKHAIIPIFISHRGCPHDCVFCNQKKITARDGDVTPDDARKIIDEWLTTLDGVETVEISFYGGSFTGIPMEEQKAFLSVAKEYKDAGKVDKIHLSTRPDYIDREILDNLKAYSVDVIELGVQSFDSDVLKLSNRGHSVQAVYDACEIIKSYGFTLGIQLMVGLPGDTFEKCVYSASETVKIGPQIARIYPTVTIKGTELYEMYQKGTYIRPDEEEMLARSVEIYKILTQNGIKVIRIGLKSSEIMDEELGFHPAFGQKVLSEVAFLTICDKIDEIVRQNPQLFLQNAKNDSNLLEKSQKTIKISANNHYFNNIFGQNGEKKADLLEKYKNIIFLFEKNDEIADEEYKVELLED